MSSEVRPPQTPVIAQPARHRLGRSLALGLGLALVVVVGLYAAAWYPYLMPWLTRQQVAVPRPPFPPPLHRVDASYQALPVVDARIDNVALRRMVHDGRYAEVEAVLDSLWRETQADITAELRLREAYDAFYVADRGLRRDIEAWIQARPRSVEADIAAALHYVDSAWAERGTAWREDTSATRIDAMQAALDRAQRYVDRASRRAPEHLMPMLARLRLMHLSGWDDGYVQALSAALERHPKSYALRFLGQLTAQPRWGGSHAIMDAIARSGRPYQAEHPALRRLEGAVAVDRADAATRAGDLGGALRLLRRAEREGDGCMVRTERASLWAWARDHGRALQDAAACLEAHPQHVTALEQKAEALYWLALLAPSAERAEWWRSAERHFARLAELDPGSRDARDWLGFLGERRDECLADPVECTGCRQWFESYPICTTFEEAGITP